jgi:hypothetical protein
MARTVYVFGAGASAHLGVPLMDRFIDVADELRQSSEVSRDAFELFFKLIQDRLPQLHAKSVVDLTNIESVFSLVEMGSLVGRLPGTPAGEVEAARFATRRVLAETVEETCLFAVSQGQWQPSSPYLSIADHVERSHQTDVDSSVALITFNYDLGLDFALHWSNLIIDYGLDAQIQPGKVPLLKLHGSLNWAACNECGLIRPLTFEQIFRLEGNRRFRDGNVGFPLRASRCLSNLGAHCSKSPIDRDPALVPPSWNKTQYQQQFKQIWRHAAKELSEADDIRVIGYSLPQSDAFFRDLLALGLAGTTRLKSFSVIDPLADVANRFQTLLGPDARGRFHHHKDIFENYAKTVLKPSRRMLSRGVDG